MTASGTTRKRPSTSPTTASASTPLGWPAETPLRLSERIGGRPTPNPATFCSAWQGIACSRSPTRRAGNASGSSRRAWRNHGKDDVTMKRTPTTDDPIDWRAADAMTEAERHAAAMADPDARPMTDDEWAAAPRVPRVAVIRRALRLSQEEFAARFHIPVGTLRDWEQGRKEPDTAARAYLRVIAREPEIVRRALSSSPGE